MVTLQTPSTTVLEVERLRERSVPVTSRPGRGMKLFHPRTDDWCHTLTSTYGGGFVDGDHLELDITCRPGSKLCLSSSGFTQIFKGASSQSTRVKLEGDAFALVIGQPLVPHANSKFTQRSIWEMDAESSLISIDWLTAGRVARGESFEFQELLTDLEIRRSEKLVLKDRFLANPELSSFRNNSSFGTYQALVTITLLGPKVEKLAAALNAFWNSDIGPQRAAQAPTRLTSFARLPKGGYQLRAASNHRRELLEVERCVVDQLRASGELDFNPVQS